VSVRGGDVAEGAGAAAAEAEADADGGVVDHVAPLAAAASRWVFSPWQFAQMPWRLRREWSSPGDDVVDFGAEGVVADLADRVAGEH
jgi:hypothetical protein